MRFRLLRRRLTISAPRMAVRSAMPWPVRWAVVAIVLGFCAAIGLWAFEFGKDIAGLDSVSKEELTQLRSQIAVLQTDLAKAKADRDMAQSIANTAGTLVTTEKASYEKMVAQFKQLEDENRSLRQDLGFFEKLIPAATGDGLAIRGFQADLQGPRELKWQVLVIQSNRNASELSGHLEVTFTGTEGGKPWTATLKGGPKAFTIKQYGRLEGIFEIPSQVLVKGLVAKVFEGNALRATQSLKL